jgi:hypothetical protein
MGRFFCRIMMTLCCTILLAASVQAKTLKEVYLKDGGIIKCQKIWQANGKVMVLVNRDILLDLSREEVDLKKTFARKPARAAKKTRHVKKVASVPGAAVAQGVAQPPTPAVVAPTGGQRPELTPKPAAKAAPSTPVTKQPAPVEVKPAPAEPAQQAAPAPKPGAPATEAPPVRENLPVAQPPVLPVTAPPAVSPGMGSANGIIMLLLAIVMIVAYCKVFEKAGEAWWKALIPIYSWFVMVMIAGKPWWWGLLILVPIVNVVIYFMINIALAKRFGQGVAFGLGLALLGFVFLPLLAFGKYEYS